MNYQIYVTSIIYELIDVTTIGSDNIEYINRGCTVNYKAVKGHNELDGNRHFKYNISHDEAKRIISLELNEITK